MTGPIGALEAYFRRLFDVDARPYTGYSRIITIAPTSKPIEIDLREILDICSEEFPKPQAVIAEIPVAHVVVPPAHGGYEVFGPPVVLISPL
jgi:hypothetical protein